MNTRATKLYSQAFLLVVFALTFGAFPGFTEPQQRPPSSADRSAGVNPQSSVRAAPTSSAGTIITRVEISRIGQQTLLRVEGSSRLTCQTERLNSPERLVLDFSGARLGLNRSLIPSALKPIRRIRLGQFKPDVARVVVDLENGVPYGLQSEGQTVTVAFSDASAAPASDQVASQTPIEQGNKGDNTSGNRMAQPRAAFDTSRMPRPKSLAEPKAALANPVAPEAKAEPFQNALDNDMLTFRAQNQTLRSILKQIGDQTKVSILLGEGLGNEQVSVEFRHYRLDEAFRLILKDYDAFLFYGVEQESKGPALLKAVWVYPASRARGFKPAPPGTSAARSAEVLTRREGDQPTDKVLVALRDADEQIRIKALHRGLSSGAEIPQDSLINLALNDQSMNVRFLALRALPRDPRLPSVAERALNDSSSHVSQMAREILGELDAANAQSRAPAANHSKRTIPFSKTKIIIEVNATDGDAGIQISLDAAGWKTLEVFDPNGEKIFAVRASGSVGIQGVTELSFESEEPSLEDVPLDELFVRFPKGDYEFVGITVDGETLSGKAKLTHNIPAGPDIDSPKEGEALDSNDAVVIKWDPVEEPFPGADSPVKIVGYQVIVDRVKPQPLRVFSVDLPATATQVTVSPEFIQANAEYKFEVLAIEASGNQTISESTFKTKP